MNKKYHIALMSAALAASVCMVSPAVADVTCNGEPWTAKEFFSGGCQKVSVVNAGDNSEAVRPVKPTLKGVLEGSEEPVEAEESTPVGVIISTDKNSGSGASAGVSVGVLN